MKIIEITQDLFKVSDKYTLVHCISADFALGAGIAVKFNALYDLRNQLKNKYPNYSNIWSKGTCIKIDNVCNLITKEKYWYKPTYTSLSESLNSLKEICKNENISYLAMPRIGCGLDKLEWTKVKHIISDIFNDMEIEILICTL